MFGRTLDGISEVISVVILRKKSFKMCGTKFLEEFIRKSETISGVITTENCERIPEIIS